MDVQEKSYVVWDLGATKCAAALVVVSADTYRVQRSVVTLLRDELSLANMATHLHQQLGVNLEKVDGVCVAAAGCYNGSELKLESGYPFRMNFAQVAAEQRWPYFEVVHDYTPVVASTFIHQDQIDDSVLRLNSATIQPHSRRLAFGIGSGLGLKDAVLTPRGEVWFGTNEVGHIGVVQPPQMSSEKASLHAEFIHFLKQQDDVLRGEVTFETILSGKGFARCYQFVSGADAVLTPPQVQARIDRGCPHREAMLSLFGWYLGVFVGSLQLAFMPAGGIWLGGGVLQKNTQLFSTPIVDEFWAGVSASPAYRLQREQFAVRVMMSNDLIFMGGAFYAHTCFAKHSRLGLCLAD